MSYCTVSPSLAKSNLFKFWLLYSKYFKSWGSGQKSWKFEVNNGPKFYYFLPKYRTLAGLHPPLTGNISVKFGFDAVNIFRAMAPENKIARTCVNNWRVQRVILHLFFNKNHLKHAGSHPFITCNTCLKFSFDTRVSAPDHQYCLDGQADGREKSK